MEIARLKAARETHGAFVEQINGLLELAGLMPREVSRVQDAVSETAKKFLDESALALQPALERELVTGLLVSSLVPNRSKERVTP